MLLTLLDSPLNKAGLLQVYIHTEGNVLIEVNPRTRIPRTYKRFAGLMGMRKAGPSRSLSMLPKSTLLLSLATVRPPCAYILATSTHFPAMMLSRIYIKARESQCLCNRLHSADCSATITQVEYSVGRRAREAAEGYQEPHHRPPPAKL